MTDALQHSKETKRLLAQRRKALPDELDVQHDKVLSSGAKVREIGFRGPNNTTRTIDVNVSKLYAPAPSTTGDIDMLRIEAELVDEGEDLDNPHVPINDDVRARAVDAIESEGLTPAWEVMQ